MSGAITTLPHYANSCAVNALIITLKFLQAKSSSQLIQAMLDYVSNPRSQQVFGLKLVEKFYQTYNLNNDFKSFRELFVMIKDTLTFGGEDNWDVVVEIDDLEKLVDLDYAPDMVAFDFGQYTSIVDDDTDETEHIREKFRVIKPNKHSKQDDEYELDLPEELDSNTSIYNIISVDGVKYSCCVFVTCIGYHYVVYVNTKKGLLVYNDLDTQVRIVDKSVLEEINRSHKHAIEFVAAIRVD